MWTFITNDAEQTRQLAVQLAALLEAGDLILLNGTLGAGKTTFTQGLGVGLDIEGRVTSPTFIISRVHQGKSAESPSLVHVDAYRIDGLDDLETLDLDSSLEESVTVVEWGEGKVEALSPSRLEIGFEVPSYDEIPQSEQEDEPRRITIEAFGQAWQDRQNQLESLCRGWSGGKSNV